MARRKTFREKITEWGKLIPPNNDYSFVEFIPIEDIDAAIDKLQHMRVFHPDSTNQSIQSEIERQNSLLKAALPLRQWKCILPRRYEAECIARFLEKSNKK